MEKVISRFGNTPEWWKEEVVYQIYPKSFYDSNNDGIGDLKGITEKLDYLKDLGVTMLWICPIFSSPMVDNGYDISDYKGIQEEFGTQEDFDELLSKAESLGIKVILDLVVNHSSDQHAWFQAALKDPQSKYRDYYIFKEGQDGMAPNNWRSIFGGSVWEKVDGEEDTYYFHTFDKRQPDLNWENPLLRQEIYDMVNWWLDKGIAGFRVDAITFIKKDQDYASMPVDGLDGLSNVKHKARNRPGIEVFLDELNHETFEKHKCVTVGEAPGVNYDEFDGYIGEGGYFNMIFDFHYADIDVETGSEWFKKVDWKVSELRDLIFQSQYALQANGWGANFLENHDQPRSIDKYIRDEKYQNEIGAKALATLFFFMRGTPFIYQGQEIGMTNFKRTSIDEFNDVSSIDNYNRSILEGFSQDEAMGFVNDRSRDNGRTPYHWDSTSNAGFTASKDSWLSPVGNHQEINVNDQEERNDSTLSFYKELIDLRQNSQYRNTLIYGEFNGLEVDYNVIAYERIDDDNTLQVFVNLSSDKVKVEIKGQVILDNYGPKDININGVLELEPYQALLVRKEK